MPKFTRNSKEVLRDGKHFGDCLNDEDAQMVCDALNRLRKVKPKGWQPIETAPKDGSVIDLWIDDERSSNCRWWGDGWEQAYSEATDCFAMIYDADPTHWMPLPEKPQ